MTTWRTGFLCLLLLLVGLTVPAPVGAAPPKAKLAHATLAGGCFWCMEAVFDQLKGVHQVVCGYAGGHTPNPTYEAVCTGTTGYAETVDITFAPAEISYKDLLRVFFTVHDPTTLNRQDNDVGVQYRSAIFTQSAEQAKTARALIAELTKAHLFAHPITTSVTPLTQFYPAEDYHQHYFARHPDQPYCVFVVGPKVAKFRQAYVDRLKR